VFRALNHLAYGTEIAAGLLLLFPPTAWIGALLIVISFAFIATQIRLGFLCEMVMLAAVLFVSPGSAVDEWLTGLAGAPAESGTPGPWWLNAALTAALLGYVGLLPLAKAGQYYNLLARKSLPRLVQAALDGYTNAFGIIIWRVFSADHTNFFARIHHQDRASGRRRPWADFRDRAVIGRYGHVGEFICLVSLFTTLKYYPADSGLFVDRLLRYARTLPCPPGSELIFEYVGLRKDTGRFEEVVAAEYTVDPAAGTVVEHVVDPTVSVRSPGRASPVHEGQRPGSYAPAESRS
jgi:hypothetical protein